MNEFQRKPGWRRVLLDELVFQGEGWLFSVSGDHTSAGNVATLYDAQSVIAGREILTLEVPANQHRGVAWWPPLPISTGLYVDMASGGTELLVQYMIDPDWSQWQVLMGAHPGLAGVGSQV